VKGFVSASENRHCRTVGDRGSVEELRRMPLEEATACAFKTTMDHVRT